MTPPPRRVPRLRSRPLAVADIDECMQLWPRWISPDDALRQAAPALLAGLIDEPALISGVMEDVALPLGQRIQAWGLTMVLPQWLTQELGMDSQPRPYTSKAVYDALLDGLLQPMSDREIGIANARGETEMMILHYTQRQHDVSDPYVSAVVAMANDTYRLFHDGYGLRSIYYETNGLSRAIAVAAGFQPCSQRDAESLATLPAELRPQFLKLGRDHARTQMPGTPARNSFESQPPLFRFSPTQRRLLWLALFDESDEVLMRALDVSVHGLKKLWRGIYERVEDASPDFFGEGTPDTDDRRGPEKRRQVLAYVRQRPEEVRPWHEARR
jgi:hypothetical protein